MSIPMVRAAGMSILVDVRRDLTAPPYNAPLPLPSSWSHLCRPVTPPAGEINPFRPPCVYPGCVVTPTYAEEGRKPARYAHRFHVTTESRKSLDPHDCDGTYVYGHSVPPPTCSDQFLALYLTHNIFKFGVSLPPPFDSLCFV